MLMIMVPTETKPNPPVRSLPPVMDVHPPKPPEDAKTADQLPAPTPLKQPEPHVSEPTPVEPKEPPKDEIKEPPAVSELPLQGPPKMTSARPPRRHTGSGVGVAIFATLVIVLGLGTLMVYAYLRTNGIAVL